MKFKLRQLVRFEVGGLNDMRVVVCGTTREIRWDSRGNVEYEVTFPRIPEDLVATGGVVYATTWVPEHRLTAVPTKNSLESL